MINKSTLEFLIQLKENNDRDWFAANKKAFETEQKLAKSFFTSVGEQLGKIDSIERIQIFRIYRDVRFSKDKSPYKNHFSVGFTRTKPMLRGGYYLHIEPGGSFVGGGFWNQMQQICIVFVKNLKWMMKKLERLFLMQLSKNSLVN